MADGDQMPINAMLGLSEEGVVWQKCFPPRQGRKNFGINSFAELHLERLLVIRESN